MMLHVAMRCYMGICDMQYVAIRCYKMLQADKNADENLKGCQQDCYDVRSVLGNSLHGRHCCAIPRKEKNVKQLLRILEVLVPVGP